MYCKHFSNNKRKNRKKRQNRIRTTQWPPQEEQPEHDVEAHDEQPDFPPAKTDMIFSAFFALHLGQIMPFSSLGEKIRLSKICLHFLHRNSYMGILWNPLFR